jgi:hypothetical protein
MSAYVFFFGGYNSTQTNIADWLLSARQQQPHTLFAGFPYPSGASYDDKSARDGFGKNFDSVVYAIQTCNTDKIYIVGHSSGCAIANEVDKRALKDTSKVDTSKVVLVALDGYAPNDNQLKRSSTQVWSARNGAYKSLHYDDLKDNPGFHEYPANKDLTNEWALHFSLVNAAATGEINRSNYDKTGYKQCQANLVWLFFGQAISPLLAWQAFAATQKKTAK